MNLDLKGTPVWEVILVGILILITFLPLFLIAHAIDKTRKLFRYLKK